jgi:hypothetical protein
MECSDTIDLSGGPKPHREVGPDPSVLKNKHSTHTQIHSLFFLDTYLHHGHMVSTRIEGQDGISDSPCCCPIFAHGLTFFRSTFFRVGLHQRCSFARVKQKFVVAPLERGLVRQRDSSLPEGRQSASSKLLPLHTQEATHDLICRLHETAISA